MGLKQVKQMKQYEEQVANEGVSSGEETKRILGSVVLMTRQTGADDGL